MWFSPTGRLSGFFGRANAMVSRFVTVHLTSANGSRVRTNRHDARDANQSEERDRRSQMSTVPTTNKPMQTGSKPMGDAQRKIEKLRELFADAPEVGKKALENVLSQDDLRRGTSSLATDRSLFWMR
jgi:hypothetical protein